MNGSPAAQRSAATLSRRTFVSLAGTASALAASGFLPALGAAAGRPGRNIFTEPAAIEPITGYLPSFRPAGAGASASSSAAVKLVYTGVSWGPIPKKRNTPRNQTTGSLTIERTATPDGAHVRMLQQTGHRNLLNRLTVEAECTGPKDEPRSWPLTSAFLDPETNEPTDTLAFRESGTRDGNGYRVDDDRTAMTIAPANPLLGPFSIPLFLARHPDFRGALSFDILYEMFSHKPDQVLHYAGEALVPCAAGKIPLQVYAQTGRGVLPIHYLVDDAGRVQLITQSMMNWALQEAG